MKKLRSLDHLRNVKVELEAYGSLGDDTGGVFSVGKHLCVIASTGDGWDHVSVSCINRLPTWDEMEHVKRLFFEDNETAMQLHVPPSEYIDGLYLGRNARFCLHLWRPTELEIPRPPDWMVGNKAQVEEFKRKGNKL